MKARLSAAMLVISLFTLTAEASTRQPVRPEAPAPAAQRSHFSPYGIIGDLIKHWLSQQA